MKSTVDIKYAIAIHGGAGLNMFKTPADECRKLGDSIETILEFGRKELASGRSALDTVESVVRLLEDNPLFNAGRGSVFNSEGKHELDASIMDGKNLKCGAVANVRTIKNPISLARLVMERTPHVFLVGQGAEQFAEEMHTLLADELNPSENISLIPNVLRDRIEIVANDYFSTPDRYEEWLRAVQKNADSRMKDAAQESDQQNKKGTVGCVAFDQHGSLAAATSTGGMTNKKFGRVGDSPIIGAGTYANNATCAVSCTGTGELFIRHCAAFQLSSLIQFQSLTIDAAVQKMLFEVLPRDSGGIIAIDSFGNIAIDTNTQGMSRGAANSSGLFEVKIAR